MKAKTVKKQRVYVGKALTRQDAWKKACSKATRDFRGMKYNPKTGWASLL